MSLFDLIVYIELITAIIGTLYFKKYFNTFLKYFLYIMWGVLFVEFTFLVLKYFEIGFPRNNFVYNVITSIQFIYYFLLYYKVMKTENYRRIIFYFLLAFIVSVIINFLWIQKLTVTGPFHTYTFTMGAILLIITIGLFFAEILNTEKVLYFKRYLMFWISFGLFLFYTGIIPYIISINLMPAFLGSDKLAIIFFLLNLMMYGCFCLGFVLSHKYSNA